MLSAGVRAGRGSDRKGPLENKGGNTLVTGGSGYIGALLVQELREAGREVRVLDSLLHGQEDIAAEQERAGVEVIRGDMRDADARKRALAGADAVVHLAAIVGDPACARDPQASDDVNVQATRALVADAAEAGVERLVFASTCSNYGRMADPNVPITEEGELRPVSLYAEQKVGMEQLILGGGQRRQADLPALRDRLRRRAADALRPDRQRVHPRPVGRPRAGSLRRAVLAPLHPRARRRARGAHGARGPDEKVAGEVFNAGRSGENYRKLDLVEEIRKQTDRGSVSYVHRDEDPRDYKVSFDKIRAELGFETLMTVPDGIAEIIAALDAGTFGDPFDGRYKNVP